MDMRIPSTLPVREPVLAQPAPAAASTAGEFGRVFSNAVESVNRSQLQAHQGIESFLAGENVELHQVAMDQQRASITFDLFLQVRNKVVQAYQEIMRMPL
jgi:flagellar hook-basal body complex protein FliE